MAIENQYNIVKVQALRPITAAQGVDEIIINDLDSSPLETKKITVENFALSIKDYILPIATEDTLGGIKVGNGLTINPITGVLSNDYTTLADLEDTIILAPEAGHVLRYNGVQWINQAEGGFTEIIGGAGLSGGGTDGVIQLDVNPGKGIIISNDSVTFDKGAGLDFNGNKVDVQLNTGLVISENRITLVLGPGIIIDNQALTLSAGRGLRINGPSIETDNGDGLTYDTDDSLTLDINQGLHFVNGKLEVNIGAGLKFTEGVLEGNAVIGELNDVEITGVTDGQILKYNGTENYWENVDVDVLELDDLGDVTITNPEQDQSLVYNGLRWVNGAAPVALDDAIYKNTVNARFSLSSSLAMPVPAPGQFYDRVYVDSNTLYLHPYNGMEVGLWSDTLSQWTLCKFDSIKAYSLSGLGSAGVNYDIYLYNDGTLTEPDLKVEFVQWTADRTPPNRDMKDGTEVRTGQPEKRYMGVIRTTSAGRSSYNLGGVTTISDGNGLNVMPHCYLANKYNVFEVNMFFIFGTAFGPQSSSGPGGSFGWAIPYQYWQAGVFPRIGFVNATNDPTRVDHDIACYVSNNHSDACIGINIPKDQYETGHSGVYGHVGGLELWSVRARSSSPYSGATSSGYFSRSFEPGFNEVTYWWDNCGGGIANTLLSHGFNAQIHV